ncbi:VgrG-related protein [Humidesulfovibrio idahonensis]
MSGNNNISDTIRILQEAESGGGLNGLGAAGAIPRAAGGKVDPKTVAFQAQMRMAQQAINMSLATDEQPANAIGSMDTAMLNDSMMMDALSTIARLTGQGPGALQKPNAAQSPEKALTRNASAQGLGSIAAMFESGEKGIAAVGFDRTGGTSYGKFQISSRAGTMNRFISFLAERDPAMAERLRRSGPANTGSTQGRMPAEWARIAAETPEKFEALQTEFIKKDHYQPAREKILMQTGVDIETAKPALREALFSTAVQHGASGAARIFNQAIDKFLGKGGGHAPAVAEAVSGAKGFEQALVSEVYNKRQNQFGGSTDAVRASVRGRLRQEKDMVLAMLEKQGMSRIV